jgi:peroxiredoxin Q/BCP
MASKASPLPAGRKAPLFTLPSSTGTDISLDDLIQTGPAVLFFYPRADTPGCTREACGFRDAAGRLKRLKAAVVGISPDPPKAVTKFADKFTLGYPLLADEDHAVADAYGVWGAKSMYGRTYMGVLRTTFVIGKNGKVLQVFENVKPEAHEAQVLAWLRENL